MIRIAFIFTVYTIIEIWYYHNGRTYYFSLEVTNPDSFCLVSCLVSSGFDCHNLELLHKTDLLKKYSEYKVVIRRPAQPILTTKKAQTIKSLNFLILN